MRFRGRALPASDAAAYVEQGLAGRGARYEARVTVHAPAERIAARLPWVAGAVEPIAADRCEYRTADDDLEWLALKIAMLGAEVEVHEPPELAEHLDALARRLRRAAARPGATHPSG